MNAAKSALFALTLVIALNAASDAQAQQSLEPDGYNVQIRAYNPNNRTFSWITVARFDRLADAEEYYDYLMFVMNMAVVEDHRGNTDDKSWEKFLDEIDLPSGWWPDVRLRITPHYDFSRYLATPSTLSTR